MTAPEAGSNAMVVGKKATVEVAIVMEYTVDVEMPVDGDPGEQADLELFVREGWDNYDEKDVLHAEVAEEEPIHENERDPEDWPSYV